MRFLYIFPHPDDESFGPAVGIAAQRRAGHEVFLLTLTKGGATKQRVRLGLSVEEMGSVRHAEMVEMAKVLALSGLEVLDFPDSGLKELDPRVLEEAIVGHMERIKPDIVVSYPVHGISGFHDHLVTHAVVKRAFQAERARLKLKRLAFFTYGEDAALSLSTHRLSASTSQEIDCRMEVEPADLELSHRALDCYQTYREVIAASNVRTIMTRVVAYEIFGEQWDPPLTDLTEKL